MRVEHATVTIYGEPDETQDVQIVYVIERHSVVIECKVLNTITIEPSDLYTDLSDGIGFNEGMKPGEIIIECEIEHKITAETVRV